MANAFYNRGANFNPDELADGDAIEAELDAVARGFDTIGTTVNANKAGYPTQTFHVAPATEATHAVRKEQLDAHINDQGAVHGATSVNAPGRLVIRDKNGDIAVRNLVGNADTATNATDHINNQGAVHGATSSNIPGKLVIRDANGDVAARTFVGDLQGTASYAGRTVAEAPDGGSATLVSGRMAGRDFLRVSIGGTADGGFAEIATADNGSEPIYVSQYSDGFGTLSHQATLLDEAGQTRFPVRIYCPSINVLGDRGGICSGNADGANQYGANVRVFSWYGIGFSPSIAGWAVPEGQNSHWFDVRTGNGGMRGTLNQWSDIRLKEDIVAIPNALEKVCSIRGVTFTRKDSGTRETGVIAQEVLSVLPEAVRVDDQDSDRMMSVAYGNLAGLLIEAIKELKAEVDELKAKIPA